MTLPNITLALAVLTTALMAGLFYSYSCSVNPGLAKLPDSEYLAAMQSINRAILNPAFFAAFFGALVLLPLAAWLNYNPLNVWRFRLLAVAALLYAAGLFGVTVFGNVPLNEMLDKFDVANASATDISVMRQKFEQPWNRYHAMRTYAVLASLAIAILACLAREVEADLD